MAVVLLVVGANVVVDVIGVATKEKIPGLGNLPKIRRISKILKVGVFKLKMQKKASY